MLKLMKYIKYALIYFDDTIIYTSYANFLAFYSYESFL